MDRILEDREIPTDAGVAIEYHIPQTSKRIDFILTGKDQDRRDAAVLIELKQWERAERTQQDAIVTTRFQGVECETLHPSYQAWSHKRLLEDFNETVQEEQIQLYPCAYLYNYDLDDCIRHRFYDESHPLLASEFARPGRPEGSNKDQIRQLKALMFHISLWY